MINPSGRLTQIITFGRYAIKSRQRSAVASWTYTEVWGARGDGWLVEVMDGAERDGFVLLHAYKGSSTYDKEQMARLIDSVVTDAKELEIETRTPAEIELMKQRWEGSRV